MVALDTIDSTQHRVVWTPAIPEKFDDGNYDGQPDARNRAERDDAGQAYD